MRTGRRYATASIALAASLAVSLSGCASTSNPSSTSVVSASGSATGTTSEASTTPTSSTPSALADRASGIIIGTSGMSVVDATGTILEELGFDAPVATVVSSLTNAFGLAPTESDQPGGLEAFASHIYEWPGFTLFDEHRPADKAVWYDYTVLITAENVNGVGVRTSAGLGVGSAESSVIYDASGRYKMNWGGETCGAESWYSPDGNIDNGLWLYICSSNDSGLVIRISSPTQLQV